MKKKKILLLGMLLTLIGLTTGCLNNKGYEIALVANYSVINDGSFNEGAWDGVRRYAEEKEVNYKYYIPESFDKEGFESCIEKAISKGAKIVICPGYTFETSIYDLQQKYPKIKMVIIDGAPHNDDGSDTTCGENVLPIYYAEQQAGFLAGYAAVKEGYHQLGFMGGIDVPAVIRYGYGYVEGADYAAQELGVDDVTIKYAYTGTFSATPSVSFMAKSMYEEGTEVIFSCGGNILNSIVIEANEAKKKVIGVDVDQAQVDGSIITSAMKKLDQSVYQALTRYGEGTFKGGKAENLDVTQDGVGLPMESSRFSRFTKEDYEAIYKKLVSGEVTVDDHTAAETVDKLNLKKVKVQVIK